ncbi:hypothetical protein IG631_05288 [Alternaria alternata]|jgi:hypothetical protein|nr:hypothetical protein IG631_05288 [Alternaria alternata]
MANALMSKCIESAMQESGFGLIRDQRGSTVNLFMVNEAEAGASYALESNQRDGVIKVRECVLLKDKYANMISVWECFFLSTAAGARQTLAYIEQRKLNPCASKKR